jgi:multiple sugar transport system substrate-binding protein
MDRFTGSQYAAIGLLEPITPLIEKYEDSGFLDSWLAFARNELTYQGQIYGLPIGTDVRALYYNKTMLRDAGIDLDELDPKNGPPTIARIMEISDKITKKDERGNYAQMGLIPWNAQGWGYTWSVGTGSSYFDDKSCSTDLTAKPIVDAFQFLHDWGAQMGYGAVNAFEAAYEPLNHPPSQTAFLGQKMAFTVQTSTTVFALAKYAPKLDYGFTYLPVFKAGDKPYTWSGGFSIVAPKGSALSEPVWNLMKFFAGKTGQSIFMPATKALPTLRELFDLPAIADMRPFIEQLTYSTSRPPIPVGSIWWDALTQVHSSMKIGSKPAQEALEEAQARVSPQMAAYCPFKLPEGYGKTGA